MCGVECTVIIGVLVVLLAVGTNEVTGCLATVFAPMPATHATCKHTHTPAGREQPLGVMPAH